MTAHEVGLLTAAPDRMLLTLAHRAGLDFVMVDAEQTGLAVRECAEAAAVLAGLVPRVAVRLPDLETATLVGFANTGADELVLPQVRHVSDVVRALEATRYPPAGTRSRQVSASSGYGADFTTAPRISVLIETVEAVEAAAELAALDDLDCGWIGTTDLADDLLRHTGDAGRARLDEAVAGVLATFAAAGKPAGLPAATPADVPAAFARGAARCAMYWEKSVAHTLTELAGTRAAG